MKTYKIAVSSILLLAVALLNGLLFAGGKSSSSTTQKTNGTAFYPVLEETCCSNPSSSSCEGFENFLSTSRARNLVGCLCVPKSSPLSPNASLPRAIPFFASSSSSNQSPWSIIWLNSIATTPFRLLSQMRKFLVIGSQGVGKSSILSLLPQFQMNQGDGGGRRRRRARNQQQQQQEIEVQAQAEAQKTLNTIFAGTSSMEDFITEARPRVLKLKAARDLDAQALGKIAYGIQLGYTQFVINGTWSYDGGLDGLFSAVGFDGLTEANLFKDVYFAGLEQTIADPKLRARIQEAGMGNLSAPQLLAQAQSIRNTHSALEKFLDTDDGRKFVEQDVQRRKEEEDKRKLAAKKGLETKRKRKVAAQGDAGDDDGKEGDEKSEPKEYEGLLNQIKALYVKSNLTPGDSAELMEKVIQFYNDYNDDVEVLDDPWNKFSTSVKAMIRNRLFPDVPVDIATNSVFGLEQLEELQEKLGDAGDDLTTQNTDLSLYENRFGASMLGDLAIAFQEGFEPTL